MSVYPPGAFDQRPWDSMKSAQRGLLGGTHSRYWRGSRSTWHTALPASRYCTWYWMPERSMIVWPPTEVGANPMQRWVRSEEHTSELQSRSDLVCRLLLEKKKHTAAPPRRPH